MLLPYTFFGASFRDDFSGAWKGGMADGWGKKQFRCGDLHEGCYKEDKRCGFGIYMW